MITPDLSRRATLTVRCPHCRASIGARCVVPSNGRALTSGLCHPARAEALTVPRKVGA